MLDNADNHGQWWAKMVNYGALFRTVPCHPPWLTVNYAELSLLYVSRPGVWKTNFRVQYVMDE